MAEHAIEIEKAKEELNEVISARDSLIMEKNKLELFQDELKQKIEDLETDLARARDDVNCRKMIIDDMSKSMLAHEQESMEMAQKLTLMKN